MAEFCKWCGNKIGFMDIMFTYKTVNNVQYCICGKCSEKLSSARNGKISYQEIATEKTAPELFDHFVEQGTSTNNAESLKTTVSLQESAPIQNDQKKDSQFDTLQNDIHQIANDLRFIKNIIVAILTWIVVSRIIDVIDRLLSL